MEGRSLKKKKKLPLYYIHLIKALSRHQKESGLIYEKKIMEVLGSCRIKKKMIKAILLELEKMGAIERLDHPFAPHEKRYKITHQKYSQH